MRKLLLPGLLVLAASTPALADNYAGADLSLMTTEFDGGDEFDTKALQFKVGTYVNPYFAVETRLGLGVDDDEVGNTTLENTYSIGAYARLVAPLSKKAEIYALAGITQLELEAETTSGGIISTTSKSSDADNDFSYGFGFNAKMDRDTALNFEYISLYDDTFEGTDTEISAVNIGFTTLF